MTSPLWTNGDWNFDLIYKIWSEIDKISNEMSLSYYPPQIEIIGSEQMLDAYTSVGMPVYYLVSSLYESKKTIKAAEVDLHMRL
jgi:stage V sporulation protein R